LLRPQPKQGAKWQQLKLKKEELFGQNVFRGGNEVAILMMEPRFAFNKI
jgi:hypothetical protein